MARLIDRDSSVTASAAAGPPPPSQTARLQLTTNPYVGIMGVFLGAGIATLNSRLISVGLPDLRGALNLGITKEEIKELIIHLSQYSGVPTAVEAMRVYREVTEPKK